MKTYFLQLDTQIRSKERPSFFRNKTGQGKKGYVHYSKNYIKFTQENTIELNRQWDGRAPLGIIKKIVVIITNKSTRGDLDNMVGAVLDVLKKAGVITDDSVKYIAHLECLFFQSKTEQSIDICLTVDNL